MRTVLESDPLRCQAITICAFVHIDAFLQQGKKVQLKREGFLSSFCIVL